MSEKRWTELQLLGLLGCVALCASGGQHLWAFGFAGLTLVFANENYKSIWSGKP